MSELRPTIPPIMGNEEETGLMVNTGTGWEDPNEFANNLHLYLPDDIHRSSGTLSFLGNGALVYAGGAIGTSATDNIERTTPECISPAQTATYIQSNELLIEEMAKKYTEVNANNYGRPVQVRIQRRVVDSIGNRKGCHDNFSYNTPKEIIEYGAHKRLAILTGHLATRSFIVGAGHHTRKGFRYSQKINGLNQIEGYDFDGFMIRAVQNAHNYETDSTGDRLEIRCNDINISPWAIQIRLGMTALVLAAIRTPLAADLIKITPQDHPIALAKAANNHITTKDGMEIKATDYNYLAVDFQERLADILWNKLGDYVPMSNEYYDYLMEVKKYCEDYRKVIKNEAPISLLANRADFAAKLEKSNSRRVRYERLGKTPSNVDLAYDDLMYDYIGVSADADGAITVNKGYGYSHRDDSKFKYKVADKDLKDAYYNPPAQTRANIRGNLIKEHHIIKASWSEYTIDTETRISVLIRNPLQHTLHSKLESPYYKIKAK